MTVRHLSNYITILIRYAFRSNLIVVPGRSTGKLYRFWNIRTPQLGRLIQSWTFTTGSSTP